MPRRSIALLGFLLHAPGLWLFARARLTPTALRLNLVVAGLTVVAVAVAALSTPFSWRAVFLAWLAGHLTWSTTLAVLAMRGHVEVAERR